jgi:hypothetical protein
MDCTLIVLSFKRSEGSVLLPALVTPMELSVAAWDGAFILTISNLENIILVKTTLKQLERQLGKWESIGASNNFAIEWDDKKQEHTIPLFQIQYETSFKERFYSIKTDVSKKLTNEIKYIEVRTFLGGLELAKIKKTLSTKNYLFNEVLTNMHGKQTWQNEAKKLTVTIDYNFDGSYTIGMRRMIGPF